MQKILLMQSKTAFKLLVLIPIIIEIVISFVIYGAWILIHQHLWPDGQPEGNKWILLPLATWAVQLVYFLQIIGIIPKTRQPREISTEPEKTPET